MNALPFPTHVFPDSKPLWDWDDPLTKSSDVSFESDPLENNDSFEEDSVIIIDDDSVIDDPVIDEEDPLLTIEFCPTSTRPDMDVLFRGQWTRYRSMLESNKGKLRIMCQCENCTNPCDAGEYSTKTRIIILSTGKQNPTNVILTFLHELAHLRAFDADPYCQAHGKEWKKEYKALIKQEMDAKVFPEDHLAIIKNKIYKNPLSRQQHLF